MFKISQFTAYPRQKKTLKLPDGTTLILRIKYSTLQTGWYIVELTHKDFSIQGMRLCNSPNLLHQFRNKIPFGLACFSKDNREPMLRRDLVNGDTSLYILTAEETEQYAEQLSGL